MIEEIEYFERRRTALNGFVKNDHNAEPSKNKECLHSIALSLIDVSETLWVMKNKMK